MVPALAPGLAHLSSLGGTLHFPSTMLRSKDKTDHLLFQEVAGCATGSARLSQAPTFMESGFKASTYWVVSLVLCNYMGIPKMPSGYSRPRLAESAKIVHLCTALVCTGRCRFRARERKRLLGQSPSPEKAPYGGYF